MNYEDRILYELRFSYKGLSDEEGDYYIDIIRHIKEMTDSERNIKESKSSSYDLVTMSLEKLENGEVGFNGAIASEAENKWLNGVIKSIGNKVYVSSELTPLHDSIMDKRPYEVADYFNFKDSKVVRKTTYGDGKYFEASLEPFSREDLENYLQGKVDHMRAR